MELNNLDDITWYPVGEFRRQAENGLYLTYTGTGKITLSHVLASELQGFRIRFGEAAGTLCFTFCYAGEEGLMVRRRQVSDSVLRRNCQGLEPGTRIYFNFNPDNGLFIESRREHLYTQEGKGDTIDAKRQDTELQP